jgi:Lon protease-like protein
MTMAEPRVMPMFPLGTVLFPHARLPLHVFEPRYRLMTQRVLAADGEFGVVLIERGSEVGGGDTRFDIGTVARVVRAQELADGGYALATVGIRRMQAVRWLPDDPYPLAEVTDVVDPSAGDADPAAAAAPRVRAIDALTDVVEWYRQRDSRVPNLPPVSEEPEQASFELAALSPIGPLDAQRVLETARADERLVLLAELLEDHARTRRASESLE